MTSYVNILPLTYMDQLVGPMSGSTLGSSTYSNGASDPSVHNYSYPSAYSGSWKRGKLFVNAYYPFNQNYYMYNAYPSHYSWVTLPCQVNGDFDLVAGIYNISLGDGPAFETLIDFYANTTASGSLSKYRAKLSMAYTSGSSNGTGYTGLSGSVEISYFNSSGAETVLKTTSLSYAGPFISSLGGSLEQSTTFQIGVKDNRIRFGLGSVSTSTNPYYNEMGIHGYYDEVIVTGGLDKSNNSVVISNLRYDQYAFPSYVGGILSVSIKRELPQTDGTTVYLQRKFWKDFNKSSEVQA